MKWKLEKGYIADNDGNIVCIIPSNPDYQNIQIILHTPEMLELISEYVTTADNGHNPMTKRFLAKMRELANKIII
jgi:hypothetical protein